ncbi:MAG: hypothetical protein ABIR79_17900 [Candidatus Binatia bacterium]
MKTFMTIVATLTFLVTPLGPLAFAHGKPLTPAFGKELVPDGQAQGGNDSKAEETEEMHDEEDKKPSRPRARRGGSGKRVHIQLDGDEDGGGTDEGDGGEF